MIAGQHSHLKKSDLAARRSKFNGVRLFILICQRGGRTYRVAGDRPQEFDGTAYFMLDLFDIPSSRGQIPVRPFYEPWVVCLGLDHSTLEGTTACEGGIRGGDSFASLSAERMELPSKEAECRYVDGRQVLPYDVGALRWAVGISVAPLDCVLELRSVSAQFIAESCGNDAGHIPIGSLFPPVAFTGDPECYHGGEKRCCGGCPRALVSGFEVTPPIPTRPQHTWRQDHA